ncbi:MAG: hypothetical protein ACP5P4_02785 [Steroidobacteraceae bacterium]
MKTRYLPILGLAGIFAVSAMIPRYAVAAGRSMECKMRFSTTSWSAIYKQMKGTGVVTCANGTTMRVRISAESVGLTAGRSRINHGVGTFTDVHSIHDVLGSYAQGEASAGMMKSGSVQVLTKGTVSLALSGTGRGIDLGVSVGKFTISRIS